jgi:predicted Fe-Mo cluster-binding NifX family protein
LVRPGSEDSEIEKQEILENPHRLVETAKGIRVAEWLVKWGVEHVGMKEDVSSKGPGYMLSSRGVKIHLISAEKIGQAISEIVAEGL